MTSTTDGNWTGSRTPILTARPSRLHIAKPLGKYLEYTREGLTLVVKRDYHPAPALQTQPDAREWKDGVKSWDSSNELCTTSAVQT